MICIIILYHIYISCLFITAYAFKIRNTDSRSFKVTFNSSETEYKQ